MGAFGDVMIRMGLLDDPRNKAVTGGLKRRLQGIRNLTREIRTAALWTGAAMTPSVLEAMKLQKAQAKTNTIFRGTRHEMAMLHEQVRKLSVITGESQTQLEEGLYQTGSSGVKDMADAMTVMRTSTMAAVGGSAEQARVVDIVTSIMRGYNKTAGEAIEITDKLFVTVDEGKTTMEQLSQNLGRAIKPAAALKIPFEELLAMTATLTQTGGMESTPEVVTEIVSTMSAIIKPTEEATRWARRLSIEFDAQTVQAKGLAYVLDQVREKAGGNTEVLGKLFPNVRSLRGVLALAGEQAGEFRRILGEMEDATGRTSEKFAEMAGTDARALEDALNAVRVAGAGIGEEILSEIAGGIRALGGSESVVARVGLAFELVKQVGIEVVSTIQTIVAGVGKLVESYYDMKYAVGGDFDDAKKAEEWRKWSEGEFSAALQRGSYAAQGAAEGMAGASGLLREFGAGIESSERDRRVTERFDRSASRYEDFARMGDVGLYNRRREVQDRAYEAAGAQRRAESTVNMTFHIDASNRQRAHAELDRRFDEAENASRRQAERARVAEGAALAGGF